MFPHSCHELNDLRTYVGHKKPIQLPSTWDYTELAPSRKVPQSGGWKFFHWRGGISNFSRWMFRFRDNRHWHRAAAL